MAWYLVLHKENFVLLLLIKDNEIGETYSMHGVD
jgi:hypothetical protein